MTTAEQKKLTKERKEIAEEILNERVIIERLSGTPAETAEVICGKWKYQDAIKTRMAIPIYPYYYDAIEEFILVVEFSPDSTRVRRAWSNFLNPSKISMNSLDVDLQKETKREQALREQFAK